MRIYLIEQLKRERKLTFEIFLRLMGFVYFCAFFSLISQVDGLYGDHGILPVVDYLRAMQASNGDLAFIGCPTLLWLAPSAQGLSTIVITGTVVSVFLMAGLVPPLCTAALYLLYLSIVSVGQEFLSYQWDMLLLQSGFLAIIVSLLRYNPRSKRLLPLATFLIFWLDLRLMFSSGICKLASNDATWADLTALTYHFFTQPLPTPLAIFANAMPLALSKFVCGLTLVIEIFVPFLVFAPRALRFFGAMWLAILQIIIALTGNYCFFNLLTIVLLVPLFDDHFINRLITLWKAQKTLKPREAAKRAFRKADEIGSKMPAVTSRGGSGGGGGGKLLILRRACALPLLAVVTLNFFLNIGGRSVYSLAPGPLLFVHALCQNYGVDNSYGLFAVMTRERPEILVEGSDDGINYKLYQFKYKVSRVDQAPPIVAPMQPRLDWQMWFEGLNATFGDPYSPERGLNPSVSAWFVKFLALLSAGEKSVNSLLAENPFPQNPPKYIRARVVNYYMTSPLELLQTGHWWKTKGVGTYYDSKVDWPP